MSDTEEDARWQAVQARNAHYDGAFYYGVLRSGLFCKPSCPVQQAQREQTRFYDSVQDAEADGLRACTLCQPTASVTAMEGVVHTVCRYIEAHVHAPLPLALLAKKSGYSAAHLQKSFLALTGMSPKAYQAGLRQKLLKSKLQQNAKVADAIYQSGYGAPSRVYEKVASHMGMTPKQYRQGAEQLVIHYALAHTRLGEMLIGATERGICFLQFGDTEHNLLQALHQEFRHGRIAPMPDTGREAFAQWMHALNDYLEGKKKLQALPLDIRGTAFQLLVWRYLQTIPAGEVRSYTEVAQAIGKPRAVRAVASACARNHAGIVIPCHRVVRGDGALAGYRWGVERKRALLALEQR